MKTSGKIYENWENFLNRGGLLYDANENQIDVMQICFYSGIQECIKMIHEIPASENSIKIFNEMVEELKEFHEKYLKP